MPGHNSSQRGPNAPHIFCRECTDVHINDRIIPSAKTSFFTESYCVFLAMHLSSWGLAQDMLPQAWVTFFVFLPHRLAPQSINCGNLLLVIIMMLSGFRSPCEIPNRLCSSETASISLQLICRASFTFSCLALSISWRLFPLMRSSLSASFTPSESDVLDCWPEELLLVPEEDDEELLLPDVPVLLIPPLLELFMELEEDEAEEDPAGTWMSAELRRAM
mmetsp:Transcript_16188/g.39980  ORF Transcript_16188/g.39980 Transcript_16188/m.39980 type:complete len:219 (-) Transcript_16188:492-1148(-)